MTMFSRRRLLTTCALGAGAALVRVRPAAPATPKEAGLSTEGLLAGEPGFQPRSVMPLPHAELPGFLSAAQLAAHHADYVAAVGALKRAEEALAALPDDAPPTRYAALRHEQVATANAVLLHEFYFRTLAPTTRLPSRYIEGHLREHMGSLERWAADFTRCALAAQRWALLVYDPYDDRWHNAPIDADEAGTWIGANPLVVCDVAEHAYTRDYHRREDYVAKFLDHLDWDEVARRYRRVDRM